MAKFLKLFVFSAAVLGFAKCGPIDLLLDADMKSLQKQQGGSSELMSTVIKLLMTLKTDVSGLHAQMQQVQAEVTGLQQAAEHLDARLAATAERLAARDEHISMLQQDLTTDAPCTTSDLSPEELTGKLIQAAKEGDLHELKSLMQICGKEEWMDKTLDSNPGGYTAMHYLATDGNVEAAELLLENGAMVDPRADGALTPLLRAVPYASETMMQLLIDHGADVNARDSLEYTPLMAAFYNPHAASIMKMLLDQGVEVDPRNNLRTTPLLQAVSYGKSEIVQMLLAYGADVNIVNDLGQTPLTMAATLGDSHLDILQALLQHGAQVNAAPDSSGLTAAHVAALHGHLLLLQALSGADFNLSDSQGDTPLQLAENENHYATAAWLRQQ